MAQPKPMRQNDIYQAKYVVDGALSPDGGQAVYVLSETFGSGDEERQATCLWQVDTDGGAPRRLTGEAGDDSSPKFAPDGRSVFFLSTRSGVPQIYRIALDGGEARQVTHLPQGAGIFDLSPNGKTLAFSATAAPPKERGVNDHLRIVREEYRMDGLGYLQDLDQAIYLMPSQGGKPKAATEHDGVISGLQWAPDGTALAYSSMGGAQASFPHFDLRILDPKAKQTQTLASPGMLASFFWCDNQRLGYTASPGSNFARQPQLFVIGRHSRRTRARTAHLDLPVGGLYQNNSPAARAPARAVLSAKGAAAHLPVGVGGELRVCSIALKGAERCETVLDGPRIATLFDGNDRQLLFATQSLNAPPELALLDLPSGQERLLTDHNGAWRARIRWPAVEEVQVRSARGTTVEGWALTPKHSRRPFKTILYIHGGPHATFGHGFHADFQELVGAGYAVAFCNPRGSYSYGDAFSTAILGCWGKPEQKDFDAFLDELVRRKVADNDRLGVTGVSGGGHLSAWLIGHTHRFKAAAPEQGVYNMFSMWGVSDAGKALISLEMGGDPHQVPERYWALSPLAHAHKCRTPSLLIQGENDIRCPMQQAEELYAALKHAGCEAELLRLQNCSHGLELIGPPPLRRYRMNALIDWFDRHIQ